ncbi:hypothetical protein AVL50_04385 [Flammeovirga sp. SJP92]|nr:hypothetical protein AVL50_04385 [Flammeovirga sp. SJP92]
MSYAQNESFSDTIFLQNGSFLYYQWNCDSTWLTFETTSKKVLKSCRESEPYLCSRTGLTFVKEYPNYLCFIHQWSSGCCSSPDLVLIDKETGNELERVVSELFIRGSTEEDYAFYFSDSSYNKAYFLDHQTGKKTGYIFNDGEVLHSNK